MASILTNGTGLFDTHVTLEDVNEAIKEQMTTENYLTAESKFQIIGDGNGFSSKVLLITCDWNNPDECLPQKLVLKILSLVHVRAFIEKARQEGTYAITAEEEAGMIEYYEHNSQQIHNQEINFYEIMKSWNKKELLLAKVYFSKRFDDENKAKGFIGMEYVEGSEVTHTYQNLNPTDLRPILKAIAKLHAGSVNLSNDEKTKLDDIHFKAIMTGMLSEKGMKGIFEKTRNFDKERLGRKIDSIENISKDILNFEKAFNLNGHLGISQSVISHGDLWSANILWSKLESEEYKPVKILDYQLVHMGNCAEDFVRLLASTLSGHDRQLHWEKILKEFYSFYQEALGENQPSYTLEQLKESYRFYFPIGALALLPLFGPVVDLKLENMIGDDVDKYREVVGEKLECLLDDIEKFHFENIKE